MNNRDIFWRGGARMRICNLQSYTGKSLSLSNVAAIIHESMKKQMLITAFSIELKTYSCYCKLYLLLHSLESCNEELDCSEDDLSHFWWKLDKISGLWKFSYLFCVIFGLFQSITKQKNFCLLGKTHQHYHSYRQSLVSIHQSLAEIYPYILFDVFTTVLIGCHKQVVWKEKSLISFVRLGLMVICAKCGEYRPKFVACSKVACINVRPSLTYWWHDDHLRCKH